VTEGPSTEEAGHLGRLFVISAPSGAGKTTLAHALMRKYPELQISVSHTTRSPRPGDRDGIDYHFVNDVTFDAMIAASDFLEWAHVHQHRYGTSHKEVNRLLAAGANVLFDVDYQGGIAILEAHPEAISVFILPPSYAELEARIRRRGTDSPEIIEGRLAIAKHEMQQYGHYKYTIVNDHLEEAIATLNGIYMAHQHLTNSMHGRAREVLASVPAES